MNVRRKTVLYLFFLTVIFVLSYIENTKKEVQKVREADYFLDVKTGNTWENKFEEDMQGTWAYAKEYCTSIDRNGSNKWRLPTKEELYRGYQITSRFKKKANWRYWSLTSVPKNDKLAYCINFHGGMMMTCKKSDSLYIKCIK
jgi:hypothetical protein